MGGSVFCSSGAVNPTLTIIANALRVDKTFETTSTEGMHVLPTMTIRFGRSICNHLPTAESREWLVTNGIGGYACGTLAGHLTRHYHGLLVAALHPPVGRTILLTRLEETVDYHTQRIALYTNRWADNSLIPKGYQQIESFQLEGAIPLWKFAVHDALLSKRIWMQHGENTTYICYTLHRSATPITLRLKAIVNYRDHHGGYTDGDWHIESLPQGICVQANPETVPFYLFASQGTVTVQPEWFHNYGLAVERYRGTGDRDSHLHAATIETTLNPGERLTVIASTRPDPILDGAAALGDRRQYEEEVLERWDRTETPQPRNSPPWIRQLALAADQFVVNRPVANEPDGKTIIAGYPWFGDWGRDTMISLPGLTVATNRPELARPILQTFGRYLSQGMLPNLFPESGQNPEYNTVDAILWYFEAIRVYVEATQDNALVQALFPALADVIVWHCTGTRHGIHLDQDDGLIYAGEAGVQLTWMDAKIGDWVITPRIGKPIEINTLWYNALQIMAQFAQRLGKPSNDYRRLAKQCSTSFQRFWNEAQGYCYDVIDTPDGDDDALRPNQIFAVALPYSTAQLSDLLSPVQQKSVVDVVARELLTSYGLRSLAPEHPNYSGHYGGDPRQRDSVYHQGPVWGWLLGPFVQAHLRVYNNPAQARELLEPMADHISDAGLGTISEIFDGNPPHIPRGCFAQAWSVSEILRTWVAIEERQ